MVARGGIASGISESCNALPRRKVIEGRHAFLLHFVSGRGGGDAFETAHVFDQLHIIIVAEAALAHFGIAGKFVVVQIDEVARRSAVAGGLFLRYPLVPTRNKDVVHIALLRFGNGIIPLFLKIRACRNALGIVRPETVVVG